MAKPENKINDEKKQLSKSKKAKAPKTTEEIKDEKSKEENKTTENKKRALPYAIIGILAIIVIAVVLIVMYTYNSNSITSSNPNFNTAFASFKSEFNSAQKIAIISQYINGTEYVNISRCVTDLVHDEVSSLQRNSSTINFYVINSTTCTYSPTGLGHTINPITTNASSCENSTASEPSIYLNYSANNYSVLTKNHLTVYGNGAYFAQCPIAISIV